MQGGPDHRYGGEFPKLQGVMGKQYALISGEEPQGWPTLYLEHYLPRFAGDKLPGSLEGLCMEIADQIDPISAAFGGLRPQRL